MRAKTAVGRDARQVPSGGTAAGALPLGLNEQSRNLKRPCEPLNSGKTALKRCKGRKRAFLLRAKEDST